MGVSVTSKKFISDDNVYCVIIEEEVLDLFQKHKQDNDTKPESGGLLFAQYDKNITIISKATVPHASDTRKRFFFASKNKILRKEIKKYFKSGFHYIGDWHTHPEEYPLPSTIDVSTIRSKFQESIHTLTHFLMIIVGNKSESLFVALYNGTDCIVLTPEKQ